MLLEIGEDVKASVIQRSIIICTAYLFSGGWDLFDFFFKVFLIFFDRYFGGRGPVTLGLIFDRIMKVYFIDLFSVSCSGEGLAYSCLFIALEITQQNC